MRDFLGTIAITGAGSGFGEALAHRYAGAGFRVAVTDVDQERAERVFDAIEAAGGRGFAQQLDVTSGADWDSLYQRILTEWGGLEILVNNAGVAAAGRLEDTPVDDWKWLLETDLMGVIRGCHRFLPLLREQRHGHVVNFSSFAGMVPMPEVSAYATAKAGVVALTEQLRVDLDRSGVDITLVCPAYVRTRLLESFRSPDDRHRQMAERWMARSRVTARQVADRVFKAVGKREFLVLTHAETRWLWRLKRWFPERFFRTMVKLSRTLKKRNAT
jgi:NADP-dependent 3-hydroxy acid dehydrogenase YdfG